MFYMKKVFAIMVLATVIGTAAFADGVLSAGVIGVPNFGTYTDYDDERYAGFGIGGYVDVKYAVLSLGGKFVKYRERGMADDDSNIYFTIGLLGKFPIAIGERFSIAPALGLEYQLFTSYGDFKRSDAKDGLRGSDYTVVNRYDNFVLQFGALADFTITGGLYARLGVLLDVGFAHKQRADRKFGAEIPFGIGFRF
jgi:hypothetical protein